jgi:hypothetical protein
MVSNLTVKVGADIDGLQKELRKATGHLDGFSKGMDRIGGIIAGAFAIDAVLDFGKSIFSTTAEFQKFEAVLTNTLGHNGAAQAALRQITEFAAKTPFQVNELTGAFVKLANQGFIPTMEQMQKLGDLSASTGKGFDQLTEAIIDAQTGEFERLKDFGIRASKEGDRVTFTFKGVENQVNFTASSIRDYILSLGDLEGVSGATAAISETLGGRLSNLQDTWDQFMLSLGKGTAGPLAGALIGLTKLLEVISPVDARSKEGVESRLNALNEERKKALKDNDVHRLFRIEQAIVSVTKELNVFIQGEEKLAEIQNNKSTPAVDAQVQSVRDLVAEWDRLNHKRKSSVGVTSKDDGSFMLDTGVFAEQANRFSVIMQGLNGTLQINSQEWNLWAADVEARTQQAAEAIEHDFAPMIHDALSGIGQALGSHMTKGMDKFGHAILGTFGGILTQLGGLLITTGIGVEAFKESLKSINGTVAIGAGIALIAMGTAISGRIRGLGDSAGSSHRSAAGSGGRSNVGNLGNGGLEIQIGGEWRIQGRDLVYIFNREQQLNRRTHG